MSIQSEEAFARIKSKRSTDAGKACVDLAQQIFHEGSEDSSKEARQWVALALQCDKAEADGDIEGLKEKAKRKGEASVLAQRAKELAAALGSTNVRPIRDGI